MKYKRIIYFLLFSTVLQSIAKEPEQVDLSLYVQPTKEAIKQIRKKWDSLLSKDQRDIERSITWSIPLNWNSNGFAVRDCATGNNRQIIITAGQAFVLTQLIDAMLRTQTGQMSKVCFTGYLQHMSNVFTANTRNPGSMPFFSPATFAGRSPEICTEIKGEVMSKTQWVHLSNALMTDSINLLAAHELGHQVYNHGCEKRTTSEIRRDEQQADDFAVELIIKEDPASLLGALPLLTFWSMNSPTTTAGQFGNTHPAGLRRMRSVMNAVEKHLDENNQSQLYQYLKKTNQLASFKALLAQLREDTKGLTSE